MGSIILIIVIGLIGVVSIFNLTIGKRNRAKATAHNKDVFGALKDKAVDEFGNRVYEEMKKVPFMSDNSNAFILCMSKKSDIMSIVTFDYVYTMKYHSHKRCEIIIEGDDKTFESLSCRIWAEELGQEVEIFLANSKHRKGSLIGKAIVQDAEDLKGYITNGIDEA